MQFYGSGTEGNGVHTHTVNSYKLFVGVQCVLDVKHAQFDFTYTSLLAEDYWFVCRCASCLKFRT